MAKREPRVYHRKDGLWEARYIKEIDITGKKKYASVYGHTVKEAKEKRQEKEDNIRLFERPVVTRNMTLYQLAEEYLLISKNRIKISTWQRYRNFVNKHISETFGKQPIIYMTSLEIQAFATDRLKYGLAPQTVNSLLVFLHSCFKYGHKQYKLPMPEITYLSVNKKEMRVLSIEEQKRLVEYLNKDLDVYKFGVLLALFTGLRIGELCSLKWEDIKEGRIHVRRTIQRLQNDNGKGTYLYIGPPKTNTSIREIPIPSFLTELIQQFRDSSSEEYVLGVCGMPIAEPRVMQLKFKKYLKEANIDKANFHSLRHGFATSAIALNFDIRSLSDVLGHANIATTLARYVHPTFHFKLSNMEKLQQIIL